MSMFRPKILIRIRSDVEVEMGSKSAASLSGVNLTACAGKHYFVIGTKAALLAYPC